MKHKHHIIPRHMGGSDDPDNIIELTIDEHAEAHRKLYEEHGRWQDKLAWQGLAKLISKEEHVAQLLREAGKKGADIVNSNGGWRTKNPEAAVRFKRDFMKNRNHSGENNPCAREYLITSPDGTTEKVKSLKTWCESKDLNYNSFHKQCVKRERSHKGYSVKKL